MMERRESLHDLEIRLERDGGDVFHSQCGGVSKKIRTYVIFLILC